VEVGDKEIQTCILARKQGVALSTAVSGAPSWSIPTNGIASFISRPSQKFVSDNSGIL